MIDLDSKEQRVLILTPLGMDADLSRAILTNAGIQSEICKDISELLARFHENYGAILLAEEVLNEETISALNTTAREQQPWSDIPLILLTGRGVSTEVGLRIWNAFAAAGNVTILERPVRTSTLISAVQVALRSRRRQYQVRKLLDDQKAATLLRDEFISIASHELKTPITSVKLQLHLSERILAREKEKFPIERMQKFFRQTGQQVDRLVRLVEDMLDVSRIHSGKFNVQREEFDLAQLVQESIDRLREQISAAGCNVFYSSEPSVGSWDRYRIEQIMTNLFTNAIRYAPASALRISLTSHNNETKLVFEDEGAGIPEANLEKIFERFERGHKGPQGISGLGLGLGLYICRQIAEAHGGSIRAEKKSTPGAKFVLRLPRQISNQPEMAREGLGLIS